MCPHKCLRLCSLGRGEEGEGGREGGEGEGGRGRREEGERGRREEGGRGRREEGERRGGDGERGGKGNKHTQRETGEIKQACCWLHSLVMSIDSQKTTVEQ